MSLWEILVIAVGLSMDAFAVALGVAASNRARGVRATFRLSFHFGLFQFLMPVCGWMLGSRVAPYIGSVDHWIACGLLVVVGGRMIREALGGEDVDPRDPSRGMRLMVLSVATSIDALAIGLTLAMLGSGIWYASLIIGCVTAGLSLLGILVGSRLGRAFGRRMEIAGGVTLIVIGLRIMAQHTL
ncbi:MAG TPA: manganese efflux pump MntP family protein [Vicinamibacterales bacterium]|jgi:putative Mn2+ efflux pump MntP